MALGINNISIGLVQNTINVHSTSSLGGLVALAQSGGVGGYAFYIWETRAQNSNRSDGVLIGGAVPYWNMYSPKIPAEWFCNPTGFVLDLRLKRNALNENGGYDFRLHDFREYEHSIDFAPKPDLQTSSLEVWEGTTIPVTARFYYGGNMDLSTASRSSLPLTHYVIVFTKGTTVVTSVPIPLDNSGTDVPSISVTAPTGMVSITIEVFLLPTNVDTGRVKITSQFMNVNGVEGVSPSATVTGYSYPSIGSLDTNAIYQRTVPFDLVLDGTYDWNYYSETQGIAYIVDSNQTPIDLEITNGGVSNPLNTNLKCRFWGSVGGSRTFRAYRNDVQIGNTVVASIAAAPNPTGYERTVNFQATGFAVNVGDEFKIIVT